MKWWKYLTIVLLLYTVVMGFLGHVPRLAILMATATATATLTGSSIRRSFGRGRA